MAGNVRLHARGDSAIDAIVDENGHVEAIAISGPSGTASFVLRPAAPVVLPGALIDELSGPPPSRQLKSWSKIQAEIKALRDEGQNAAAAARETLRDELRAALVDCSVDLGAAAGGFLGINGLPLQAGGQTSARLSIDLVLLDPMAGPATTEDAPILSASLVASGAVAIGAVIRAAAIGIRVLVTRSMIVQALPSISIEPLAGLPALDLQWPVIEWPELSWPSLDLRGLEKLLRLDLPLPRIDAALPLRVDWKGSLEFVARVDETKRLAFATNQPATGTLIHSGPAGSTEFATIEDFAFSLSDAGDCVVAGLIAGKQAQSFDVPAFNIDKPHALPFAIAVESSKVTLEITGEIYLGKASPTAKITATLDLPRILIRAKSDPALLLALHAAYRLEYDPISGETSGKLTELEIVEPYPVKLLIVAAKSAADAAEGLFRLLAGISLPRADLPQPDLAGVLERLAAMVGAAVSWLARQASAAADALLGVAEAIAALLADLIRQLAVALKSIDAAAPQLIFEVRLDSRSYALRQIIISPAWEAAPDRMFNAEGLGLSVAVPLPWTPALVIDLDAPVSVAFVLLTPKAGQLRLGTDLWLARQAGIDAVRDTDEAGGRAQKRLIEVVLGGLKDATAISLLRVRDGQAAAFETMTAKVRDLLQGDLHVSTIEGRVAYGPINWGSIEAELLVADDLQQRLLPFLQSPKGAGSGGLVDRLSQYITVQNGSASITRGKATVPLTATLHVGGTTIPFNFQLSLDLNSLKAGFDGDERVQIKGKADGTANKFDLLGLTGLILPSDKEATQEFAFFTLDFSGGDVRLSLAEEALLDLSYGKVASDGRGIVFRVDTLAISRSGLDLDARVDPDVPVQLAGVGVPFRFDAGGLSIKGSEIQAFSIHGAGQLPPELVGEANVTIAVAMARGKDGTLAVQSAEAKLDKSNDPIVCHATRFTFTLSAIGFEFRDFSYEGAGYHFFFTLTGTAQFSPGAGEFGDGLLKNLKDLTIVLDKAPLARDASMLLKAIEFQVAVEPKKRFNVFNLFTFELRGIGLHPSSSAFQGAPAMALSGQVNFVEAGDIVSPKFDFHKMWIAPPEPGSWLPRIRFDGLTVGVRFGGAASIEGTAIAVDDTLPSLFRPGVLPADVTARGFLAAGKLSIKGWGSMSASMGFLELRRKGGGAPRQAFFLYAQQDKLSIEIPTPLGPIYLREVGFGFGFRYTLAAFNAADQVQNVNELVKVLDKISAYQGDLHSVRAWEPEADGNRLTLALRGLITITTASSEKEYNASGEKDLPNPVLFDIVAALRSDLTFFMSARVWLCFNYADWYASSANDSWRTRPTLRGYAYLSVPRREFLSRLVADGKGEVGEHPKLPGPLVQAMKNIRWSATTYIRPGLFHQEFGWPYELGFTFEQGNTFRINCQGGLVNRIEDGAMLYGIAFRAKGFAQIGGAVGGRSFGASVLARADFAIDAKFIAYVSVTRFKDTLFYGSVAFTVSIRLEVRIWLEIDLGFTEIRLEVGFALSLTISVALEAAVWPGGIAGRGSASVAVGAFGRTIRLGIGFGFNEGGLAQARARVERFLALGLAVDTPDPEKGVAPPAVEAPRGPKSAAADQALEDALAKQEKFGAAPAVKQESAQGRPLQPVAYWAMLFPVAGTQGRYLMALVPRDHSPTGLKEDELPTDGPPTLDAGGKPVAPQPFGTFYPPLLGAGAPLRIEAGQTRIEINRLKWEGGLDPVELEPGATRDLPYHAESTVVPGDPGKSVSLRDFLAQCYVRRFDGGTFVDLREPLPQPLSSERARLPETREAAAQALAEAGRDQLGLAAEQQAAGAIEERRSAAIAALCNSATTLAAEGPAVWTAEAVPGLDLRVLSALFVVEEADLDALFPTAKARPDMPRRSSFSVFATDPHVAPINRNVHLFNPPERMFRRRNPRFAEPVRERTPTGIRLDWDLEPAFGRSDGVWRDPEYQLKHYRIERIVTETNSLDSLVPPMSTTVKAAAPLRLARDRATQEFQWGFWRPNAQFMDDLSDLSEQARALLLPRAEGSAPAKTNPVTGVDRVSLALQNKRSVVLRYTIVPVDCAGTSGAPTVMSLEIAAAKPKRKSVSRAVLVFDYQDRDPVGDIDAMQPKPKQVLLGVDDGNDDPDHTAPSARRYVLRIREERGLPSGLYGSDAVTDARARPSAGDFALKRPDDQDYELGLPANPDIPRADEPLPLGKGGFTIRKLGDKPAADPLKSFFEDIGIPAEPAAGPRGFRFAIRPASVDGEAPPAWCPVDITMLIRQPLAAPAPGATPPQAPAATSVEVFEHPVRIDAAPLMAEDLDGEAGRLLILRPPADGSLEALLKRTAKPEMLRDPARRVGTRLRWNARPAAKDCAAGTKAASELALFFGGFDVAELDAAGEVEGAESGPAAGTIRCIFSAATGGDPGKGMLRLDRTNQGTATRIYVDTAGLDDHGREMLERLGNRFGAPRFRLRLVKAADARKWIDFDLAAARTRDGFGVLSVVAFAASGANPIGDKNAVKLVFRRDAAMRNIARVQALPTSLARLDPAEIADFAKVEAHYPSETRRVRTRSDGARLGAWYSPAESFVVWPDRTPRRSLSINVDETILTELIAGGRPVKVAASLAIRDGLKTAVFRHSDRNQTTVFAAPKGGTLPWLRALLQDLVWDADSPDAQAAFRNHPEAFRTAQLTLQALAGEGKVIASVTFGVDLDPPLHPVLADVIDWARYDESDDRKDTLYRRFEPVLEPLPKTGATDAASWLDVTAPERDPYGWGIMRTLGLAAGLKLYDTELRDYAPPEATLKQMQSALDAILPRYRGLELGAPFVDIVMRAGGTMALASFDGGSPSVTDENVETLLGSDALALMQIALRPVADRQRLTGDGVVPVAYAVIRTSAPGETAITIDLGQLANDAMPAVVEVIDLTSDLAKAPFITLMPKARANPLSSPDLRLREDLAEGAGDRFSYVLDVSAKRADEPVALIRMIAAVGDARTLLVGKVAGGSVGPIFAPHQMADAEEGKEGDPAELKIIEPFGRFPELSARRFGALAARQERGQPPGQGSSGDLLRHAGHPSIRAALDKFQAYTERAFAGGWPREVAAEAALISRLPDWTRRFLEYGLGESTADETAPGPAPMRRVRYALAEVTRPDPWRVGIGADGKMQVLFTHDDRKRRLKRYAIKPFGRYDNFVESVRLSSNPEARQAPAEPDAWADYNWDLDDGVFQENWNRRFFDVVIPRTEPVAPPHLIHARRIEMLAVPQQPPRRMLEFLYARHPEEILSEANVTVEGALSFESVSFGLWREFAAEGWAAGLGRHAKLDGIDTAAGFGSWNNQARPPALLEHPDKFGGLVERHPDGWRGVMALRAESLPYFFRIHAAAYASAGVVVSTPVAATIAEGDYDLILPWTHPAAMGGTPGRVVEPTPPPAWTAHRVSDPPHAIDANDANDAGRPGISVVFTVPLARFVDCMTPAAAETWLRGRPMPEVFTLPDPAARYEIALVSTDSAGLSATSPELDVVSEIRPALEGVESGYRVNVVGPVFDASGEAPSSKPERQPDRQTWWKLDVVARVKPAGIVLPDVFQPAVEPAVPWGLLELSAAAFAEGATWAAVAPSKAATLGLTPPADPQSPAAWALFKQAAASWRDEFSLYRHAPAGEAIWTWLDQAVNLASPDWWKNNGWVNADGTLRDARIPIADFWAGLPQLAEGRPAAVTIRPAEDGSWAWRVPEDTGVNERNDLRSLELTKWDAAFDPATFEDSISRPIRTAMRQLGLQRMEMDPANRFSWTVKDENTGEKKRVFAAPFSAPVPEPLREAAYLAAKPGADGSLPMPDVADVLVTVPLKPSGDRDKVMALIAAVEARPSAFVAAAELGAWEEGSSAELQLHLPCKALANSQLRDALAALDAGVDTRQPAFFLLRMPPDAAECKRIFEAIGRLPDDGQRNQLRAFAAAAMAAQLFGVGRRPTLKVYRGLADPKSDDIQPAGGGL